MTTHQQRAMILDFIQVARGNGITQLWAALPRDHALVRANHVGQIRVVKDALARGRDELGNRVRLTPDLRVIQE
jgi:hypothetical protein